MNIWYSLFLMLNDKSADIVVLLPQGAAHGGRSVYAELAILFLWQKCGVSSVWDSHSIFGKPQKGYLVLQNQVLFLTQTIFWFS